MRLGGVGYIVVPAATTAIPELVTAIAASGPAAPIVAAVAGAIGIATWALSQIGQGREEADIIVPVQNAIGERLAEIVADQDRAGVTRLQDYYQELTAMALAFDKFLQDPSFVDGRASQQAHNDIIPLIENIQAGIAQRIQQRGASIPLTPTVTQGAGYILPRLSNPAQTTFPAIPQSGTIWPNAPLPTVRPQPITQVAGFDPVSMLMIAGVAFAFLRKGRR